MDMVLYNLKTMSYSANRYLGLGTKYFAACIPCWPIEIIEDRKQPALFSHACYVDLNCDLTGKRVLLLLSPLFPSLCLVYTVVKHGAMDSSPCYSWCSPIYFPVKIFIFGTELRSYVWFPRLSQICPARPADGSDGFSEQSTFCSMKIPKKNS